MCGLIPVLWVPKTNPKGSKELRVSETKHVCFREVSRVWGKGDTNCIWVFVVVLFLLFCFLLLLLLVFTAVKKMFDKNNRGKIYFCPCFQRVSITLSSSVHAAGVPVGSYSHVAREQKVLMEPGVGLTFRGMPLPPTYYFSQIVKAT